MSRGERAGASGATGGWSGTGGGPGLVSRILRVELTMGYKEEEGALVGKDRLLSSHLLPLYHLLDVFT